VTSVQTQLKDIAGTFELKRTLLQTALDGLQKVARTEKTVGYNADLSIAIAHQRMGKILEYLGRPKEAREEYQKFHQVIAAVSGPTPSVSAKGNLAISLTTLGNISLLLGDREKAREYYSQAHDLRKEVSVMNPGDIRSQRRLATSLVKLGDAGDHEEAETYYYEALRLRKEFAENTPDTDRPNRLRDVWLVHNKIGDLLLWQNRQSDELLERAENHYREAFDIARELHHLNKISPRGRQDFAVSKVNIGNLMLRRGNRPESIRVYEDALQLLEPVATNDPENIDVQGSYVLLLARCRRLQKVETKIENLRAMAPQVYRNLYNVACCYSLCAAAVDEGERKREFIRQALDALDQAIRNGLQDASYIQNDSDFDAIRSEERYKKLLLAAGISRADKTRSAQKQK
jgi:tetratricopeptide (TPR) repeat protein